MADNDERVLPVEPIHGGRTYPVGAPSREERPPRRPATAKQPSRKKEKSAGECVVTADHVDCKI